MNSIDGVGVGRLGLREGLGPGPEHVVAVEALVVGVAGHGGGQGIAANEVLDDGQEVLDGGLVRAFLCAPAQRPSRAVVVPGDDAGAAVAGEGGG